MSIRVNFPAEMVEISRGVHMEVDANATLIVRDQAARVVACFREWASAYAHVPAAPVTVKPASAPVNGETTAVENAVPNAPAPAAAREE